MTRTRTRPLLVAILLTWISLVIFAAHLLMQSKFSRWERHFEADVGQLTAEIKNKLDTNEAVLAGFSAFLQAVDRGDSDSTFRYAASATASYPQIYMIEVARKVPASEQASFQVSLRKLWRPDFSIKQFADLTHKPIKEHSQSSNIWPILFMYPSLPEVRDIYGVRLETVDYIAYSLALAQNSPKAVVSPVFELYEGGSAYILLKEVSRPRSPSSTSLNLFGDTMVALLVIKTGALLPLQLDHDDHDRIRLIASMSAPNGTENILFVKEHGEASRMDKLFLPNIKRRQEINNASQPVNLLFERQMLWSELMTGDVRAVLSLLIFMLIFVPWLTIRHYRNLEIAETAHERSAYLATHDQLTELPNRFLFVDRFNQAVLNSERNGNAFALLLIDLDHFKLINDNEGHDIGDQVLVEAAKRMVRELRSIDTVGRLGGDEFVIILNDVLDENDARTVGEKLRQAIASPMTTSSGTIEISCSIGIALYPEHGKTLDMLKLVADKAMYLSKNNGRNLVTVSPIKPA